MMDDGQWIISPHGWVFFLYVLCKEHVLVSLQIAALAQNMTVGDASQITPIQVMDVFVLCCLTQNESCNFDFCKSLTCYTACIN